ncbi:MAG: 50S ribosomal protein L21 [Gammaproteobacteria bacterium]|nr:50S ribosomal protein L21 [Gammaproteobacteria bacterium]
MYAVIETGGKQFRVAIGDKLKVETIPADAGATVELEKVLMIADGDKVEVGTPHLDGTKVLATVVSHGRGEKIRVFKMRRRKNYRRSQGHRQAFTELEITGIGDVKAEAPRAKRTAAKKEIKSEDVLEQSTAPGGADDLTQIDGVGPVLAKKLNDIGITRFEQIAVLTSEDIVRIDEQFNFSGRIERDNWIEQAKKLSAERDQS